jgi:excisionase family DNA binding protein
MTDLHDARPAEALTLDEAAEVLGVHYMTVYRYVRLGRLPAAKVDGRWKVDAAALARLEEQDASPPARRGRPQWRAQCERLRLRLVAGDELGAWAVLERALVAGARPIDLYLQLLGPALRTIGEGWSTGVLTVADEHRASVVARRLQGRLGSRFTRPGRTRGAVLLGGAPGDHHALPVAMLADVVRGAGFTVVDLGADTPVAAFAAVARAESLLAAGVSVSTDAHRRGARRAVHALHRAVPGLPVLVGGPAVRDDADARSLGGDGSGADAALALAALEDLVAGPARPEPSRSGS